MVSTGKLREFQDRPVNSDEELTYGMLNDVPEYILRSCLHPFYIFFFDWCTIQNEKTKCGLKEMNRLRTYTRLNSNKGELLSLGLHTLHRVRARASCSGRGTAFSAEDNDPLHRWHAWLLAFATA